MARAAFEIGGDSIAPGKRAVVDLPLSLLSNHTPITLPVQVVHGRRAGPVMFVSAAIHGDEICGVEIVRRLLAAKPLRQLRGTLLAIPIVNAFGFIHHERYLPDRRDLNRAFPGSEAGSLAARLAHLFLTEIVARSDFGIDLHTAAMHRNNLPQLRIEPGQPALKEMARAFGAPVVLEAKLRDGSLRRAAREAGVDVLLYEGGEGLRFDERAIRAGVSGILRVMRLNEMVPASSVQPARAAPIISNSSAWERAPAGGILRSYRTIGDVVREGDLLGVITDPFGTVEHALIAPKDGIVIGRTMLPVVNEGDAIYHIAKFPARTNVEARMETIDSQLSADPLFDEDEII